MLQEYCQKRSLPPPQYNSVATEGGSHQPIFIFECCVEQNGQTYLASGNGSSKKCAKHESARNVLKKIHEALTKENETSSIPGFDIALEDQSFGQTPSNPVTVLEGRLKEKKLAMPQFKTTEGADHQYYAECRVEHLKTEARGPSKKTAKRSVAQLMLDLLDRIGDEELQKELNRVPSVASVLNGPIKERVADRKKDMNDQCGLRPEMCKFQGRLNENFEDIDPARSEGSTNTFGVGLIKVFMQHRKHSTEGWSDDAFEAFVKLCADNAIPVRESKDISELYLILVHLKNPLTFFGTGTEKEFEAKQKTLDYFKSMMDHIQREDKRAKEAEQKKRLKKQRGYR